MYIYMYDMHTPTHPHQAIYHRGSSVMSVNRLLELLKQFKDSTNKKERVRTLLILL